MKTVKIIDAGGHKGKDLVRELLRQAPTGGFDLEGMEQRIELRKLIAGAGETLALEDAQFAQLKQALTTMKYNLADEDVHAILRSAITSIEPPAA